MAEESLSLQSAFTQAESKCAYLDHFSSSSAPDYQAALASTIGAYTQCRHIVDQLSLFSPNESLEDIASNELQYLLLDYYLADLTLKRTSEISARKGILDEARTFYERFLGSLDSYDILSKDDTALWEQYRESRDTFSIVMASDAAVRRDKKITRFKVERDLKRKLEVRVVHFHFGRVD